MRKTKFWEILILNFHFLQTRLWVSHSLRLKIRTVFQIAITFLSWYVRPTFRSLIRRIRKIKFPIEVAIETITFCNSRCIICPNYDISKELPQGRIPWGLYKKIIDECSKYRVSTIYPYLTNEPLLDTNIIDRIQYAKEKIPYIKIFLSTNASLLTPEKTHQLLKYVDIFSFSIFGITKHDYEKNMPGLNYEKTMENIDYFIRFKKEKGFKNKVMIRTIITQDNLLSKDSVKQLKKIYNFWDKKGIIWTCLLFFSRAGNVKNIQYNPKQNKLLRGCWLHNAPLRCIYIIFNGDVILCCMDCRREVVLGNINEKSLYEIWNSELYDDIRDKIYLNKKQNESWDFLCNRCLNPFLDLY